MSKETTDTESQLEIAPDAPDGMAARTNETEEPVESTGAIIAAILANIAVGVVKFIAAFISGSSAMISEGIHSIVDSGNGLLLLFGMKRASRKPDLEHPFGYSHELYFWTLVVAVMIFALGGGFSIYEGIDHLTSITPDTMMGDPLMRARGVSSSTTPGSAMKERHPGMVAAISWAMRQPRLQAWLCITQPCRVSSIIFWLIS